MGRKKVHPSIEGEVLGVLAGEWAERRIINYMNDKNISIFKLSIHQIKNRDCFSTPNNENLSPNRD